MKLLTVIFLGVLGLSLLVQSSDAWWGPYFGWRPVWRPIFYRPIFYRPWFGYRPFGWGGFGFRRRFGWGGFGWRRWGRDATTNDAPLECVFSTKISELNCNDGEVKCSAKSRFDSLPVPFDLYAVGTRSLSNKRFGLYPKRTLAADSQDSVFLDYNVPNTKPPVELSLFSRDLTSSTGNQGIEITDSKCFEQLVDKMKAHQQETPLRRNVSMVHDNEPEHTHVLSFYTTIFID